MCFDVIRFDHLRQQVDRFKENNHNKKTLSKVLLIVPENIQLVVF